MSQSFSHDLAPIRQEEGRARVAAALKEMIAGILPGLGQEQITEDRDLRDLGADSVDRVEIIQGMLSRLRLRVPMSSFNDLPHIGALVDLLAGLAGPAGLRGKEARTDG